MFAYFPRVLRLILKGLRSYISCVVKSLSSEPNIGGIDIYLVTILGWPKSFNHDPEIAEVLPISNFSRTPGRNRRCESRFSDAESGEIYFRGARRRTRYSVSGGGFKQVDVGIQERGDDRGDLKSMVRCFL